VAIKLNTPPAGPLVVSPRGSVIGVPEKSQVAFGEEAKPVIFAVPDPIIVRLLVLCIRDDELIESRSKL
jgi:hypothetical protein